MARVLALRDRQVAFSLPLLALAALTAPDVARADGFSLRLEPGYSASTSSTTAEGVTSEVENTAILQKYGLTLDKTLWPLVRFGGGGLLDWTQGTSRNPAGDADADAKRWLGYARLDVGGPGARGGAGYNRLEDSSRVEPRAGTPSSARLVNEVVNAWTALTPDGLPSADLRLSRTSTRDPVHGAIDTRNDDFLLSSKYAPIPILDLRYALRSSNAVDHVSTTETRVVGNLIRAAYQDEFLERRLTVYASYDATRRDIRVTTSGVGGLVSEQQFPIRGLSALEIFPAVPERIALEQNPALTDANVATSAGIDIGFSRTLAGDTRNRHAGVQFADTVTPVNTLFVWIDRQLPADVVNAYRAAGRWRAFQSDDNLSWTELAVGAVEFGTFQSRFELAISETRARYLKVVTAPLPVGVTFDQQLASVFVTEIQAYRVQEAARVQGRHSTTRGNLNGALRYDFASVKGLSYDLTTSVRHGTELGGAAWVVTNGLAYFRRLAPALLLTARVDRNDSDEGRGHEAGTRYALTLGATPLPTLTASASVSGGYDQTVTDAQLRNAILATVTADLYRGVVVSGSGSATHVRSDTGRTGTVLETRGALSLVPHRTLSISGSFAASDSASQGGGSPGSHSAEARAEAAASFTPFPALYLSGSVARLLYGPQAPDTLTNLGASLSPLPGAPLLLRFTYQESFDTSQQLRTRVLGPGLRWNIRPGWFFDVNYTRFDSASPTVETESRVFFASLFAVLGQ